MTSTIRTVMSPALSPARRAFLLAGGALLLAHFSFTVFRACFTGHPEDLLWASHAGTFLGGVGAITRKTKFVSVALVLLLTPHAMWMLDVAGRLILGRYPLGLASYLETTDWWEKLQSANHVFTVPVMLASAWILGGVERRAWWASGALLAVLTLASAVFCPAASNVNLAHHIWPGLDRTPFRFLELLPRGFYLASVLALNILGNHWPVNAVLTCILPLRREESLP